MIHADHQGQTSITIPNKAEKSYYLTGAKLKGVVSVCWAGCGFGKCPKCNIGEDEYNEGGAAAITVNGEKVTSMAPIGGGCVVFKNKKGFEFLANSAKQYTISVDIKKPKGCMRFSSIAIW